MDAGRWTSDLLGWRDGAGPLNARLAAALRSRIRRGELGGDEALPPERALAAALGVSRSTVVAAYDDLGAEGLLVRRRGSGTRVAPTVPRRADVLALRTPPVGAGVGELDFTIAVPLLDDAQRAELAVLSAGAFRESLYHPLGLPDLRTVLADLYTAEGLPTTPEQVVVTSGAQQAISLLAATLLRPGDAALLETPTYFGAIDVFRLHGAELCGVPLTPQGLDVAAFAALSRTRAPRLAFVTPTFQNPTGTLLPPAARERLAHHIADRRLPTIEDDTLLDLSFGAPPPPRVAAYAPDAPIVSVGSLSKLYWAGLRVGWMRLPPTLLAPVVQAKTLNDFGSGLPSQHLALGLLRELPRLRAERAARVRPARDTLAALLRAHLPDWRFTLPGGGQYLWVELPTPQAGALVAAAARTGVRLFPGASMGVSPLPDTFLRLPFTLAPAQLPDAVARLKTAWGEVQAGRPLV